MYVLVLLSLLDRIVAVARCSLLLYGRGSVVCLSVGDVRKSRKTAEPIEMPFGWVTRVCPIKNHVIL